MKIEFIDESGSNNTNVSAANIDTQSTGSIDYSKIPGLLGNTESISDDSGFVRGVKSFTGGLVGGVDTLTDIGKRVGIPGFNKLHSGSEKLTKALSVEDQTLPEKVLSGLGSIGSFFIPAAGVTKIGKAVGMSERFLPKLAMGTASLLESTQNANQVYQQNEQTGMNPDENLKRSMSVFAANIPLNYITDQYLFKGFKSSSNALKQIGTQMIEGALTEPVQETTQQAIQNLATNTPLTEGLADTALVASITGGLGGGAITGLQTVHNMNEVRKEWKKEVSKNLDRVNTEYIKENGEPLTKKQRIAFTDSQMQRIQDAYDLQKSDKFIESVPEDVSNVPEEMKPLQIKLKNDTPLVLKDFTINDIDNTDNVDGKVILNFRPDAYRSNDTSISKRNGLKSIDIYAPSTYSQQDENIMLNNIITKYYSDDPAIIEQSANSLKRLYMPNKSALANTELALKTIDPNISTELHDRIKQDLLDYFSVLKTKSEAVDVADIETRNEAKIQDAKLYAKKYGVPINIYTQGVDGQLVGKTFRYGQTYSGATEKYFNIKDENELRINSLSNNFKQAVIDLTKEKAITDVLPSGILNLPVYGEKSKQLGTASLVWAELYHDKANPMAKSILDNPDISKLSKEQMAAINLAKEIEAGKNGKYKNLVESINGLIEVNKDIGQFAFDNGVINTLSDYAHISRIVDKGKVETKEEPDTKGKLGSRFGRRRVYDSVVDAWINGDELMYSDIADLSAKSLRELNQKAAYVQLIDDMMSINNDKDVKDNLVKPTKYGVRKVFETKQTDGYMKLSGLYTWETDTHKSLKLKDLLEELSIIKDGMVTNRKEKIVSVLNDRSLNLIAEIIGKSDAYVKQAFNEYLKETEVKYQSAYDFIASLTKELNKDTFEDFRIDLRDPIHPKVSIKTSLYAPIEIAKNMNKLTGSSQLKHIDVVDKFSKLNTYLKHQVLTLSFFHNLAFTRSYMLTIPRGEGASLDPRQAWREGISMVANGYAPLKILVGNGLTLGQTSDFEEDISHMNGIVTNTLSKYKATAPVAQKVMRLFDAHTNFLFNQYGVGLKAMVAVAEFRKALAEHPDIDPNQIARDVANLVNDDFGGLHLKRRFRSPTGQHLLQMLMLAPDWTESNTWTLIKAFNNKAGWIKKHGQASGTHYESEIYKKFWAKAFARTLVTTMAANLLIAGIDDKDFIERYKEAWDEGSFKWMMIDVTPIYRLLGMPEDSKRKYFSIPGHFLDPVKWFFDNRKLSQDENAQLKPQLPLHAVLSKMSVMAQVIKRAFDGSDWRGRPFSDLETLINDGVVTEWGDAHPLTIEQVPSYLLYTAGSVLPIPMAELMKFTIGQQDAYTSLGNMMGLGIK